MRRGWLFPPALALLAGCSNVTFSSERLEAIQRELNRHHGLWKSQAIAAYEYSFVRFCFCPPSLTQPMLVSVLDSAVVAVSYADSGTAVPDSALSLYFTVEGLFRQA